MNKSNSNSKSTRIKRMNEIQAFANTMYCRMIQAFANTMYCRMIKEHTQIEANNIIADAKAKAKKIIATAKAKARS